jgi:hypothetical protein
MMGRSKPISSERKNEYDMVFFVFYCHFLNGASKGEKNIKSSLNMIRGEDMFSIKKG